MNSLATSTPNVFIILSLSLSFFVAFLLLLKKQQHNGPKQEGRREKATKKSERERERERERVCEEKKNFFFHELHTYMVRVWTRLLETSKIPKNGEKKIFFPKKKTEKKKFPRFFEFLRFPIIRVDTRPCYVCM
jgi:hypothetical protein